MGLCIWAPIRGESAPDELQDKLWSVWPDAGHVTSGVGTGADGRGPALSQLPEG